MNNSTGIMKSMRTTKNNAMKEVKLNNSTRVALVGGDITSMAQQNTDAVISIGGRSWRFPGARTESNSWEGEFHGDGRMRLHDDTGAVIEGIEVDNPEDAGLLAIRSPQERRLREVNLASRSVVLHCRAVTSSRAYGDG
jgi:hypothetical protein